MVVTVEGEEIRLALDTAKWTEIMDGQWEIKPIQQTVKINNNINQIIDS